MTSPTKALLEYTLQQFADSERRFDEYVQQRIRLELDAGSYCEEPATQHGVTLTMRGAWSVSRDFDYGDGPGSSDYCCVLKARLTLATAAFEPPHEDDTWRRADCTVLLGRHANGEVTWHDPTCSVPHWLARKPMSVPEGLRAPLLRWPSLSLLIDLRERLS